MDSHLIYTASDSMKNKVNWIKVTPDSEWFYFGINDEIKKKSLVNAIDNHFAEDTLYVAFTRKESFQTSKRDIAKTIDNLLGFQDFFIWDTDFKKVMEFNKIGTLRCGQLK
jgi:hypothetical protein